jgi:hypothetical protein
MRTRIFLTCLLSCSLCSVYAQQKAIPTTRLESTTLHPERYRLVEAQVESTDGTAHHELFLLDQRSGKLWRYQRPEVLPGKDGKTVPVQELLIPVEFVKFREGANTSEYQPEP